MSRKLHELIAVEPELKATAKKIENEAVNTFTKKQGLFNGQHRYYKPMFEGELELPDEKTEITTTVNDKLSYVAETVSSYINAMATKEKTNTLTSADVIVDGKTILEGVPAIILLSLEQEFKELRKVYEHIPSIDPSETWTFDSKLNYYASVERETFKTKKILKNHVKAKATKEHPEQVEVFSEDTPIGRWFTKKYSGMKTPTEKHKLLSNVDTLIRALKEARQRANNIQISEFKVAKKLFDFINGG